MPRILIAGFCAVPGPDRVGVQLGHVIRALAQRHQVDVLVVRRGDQAYVEKMAGARILRVPVPDGPLQSRVDAFRRALVRQIDGADYDVIHFRDGWAGLPVLQLRGRLKYAAVFDAGRSPRAEIPALDYDNAARLEQAELRCLAESDMVLAATEPARQHFATITAPERVHLVPPGVDVDLFDWDEPALGPPTIVYAGSLTPGRGVRVLLRAMMDVAAQSDARLALVGRASREFLGSLQKGIRDLNLTGRVAILGEVPHAQVPGVLASASVCVAPGAPDLTAEPIACYPTKLLEYLACQRAVVVAGRGTVSMILRDGQHALLFEPGQPLDLAEKLLVLLRDTELRARVARAGYELVRRVHTASALRRSLRRAYAWMASIAPWRDRFAARLAELPTGDMPTLSLGDPTGSGGWVHARPPSEGGESIAAFEGEMLDDVTSESQQVDTGLNEGLGEVTKVEAPLMDEDDRGAYQPLATAVTAAPIDDWVVEDSRNRAEDVPSLPERSSATPVDSRFVAGELEIPTGRQKPIDPLDALEQDEAFTAMAPPLGIRHRARRPASETATNPIHRLDPGDPDDMAATAPTVSGPPRAMRSARTKEPRPGRPAGRGRQRRESGEATKISVMPTMPPGPGVRPAEPAASDDQSPRVPPPSDSLGGASSGEQHGDNRKQGEVPVVIGGGEDTGP